MKTKKEVIMKFVLTILCLYVITFSQNQTFDHNGVTREYILYKPGNLQANAPLVFVLHGYTSTNQQMMLYGMNSVADKNGFAVCYPQGLEDNVGTTHWNAKLKLSSVDDIGFLTELAKHLQSEHNLNPQGTFSTGFSNGGFMSYTLASEAPEIFKAVAPVSGLMSGDTWNEFNSTTPVPILHIHGIDDKLVPIDGSMSTIGGWGGGPSVDSLFKFWAQFNNCKEKDTTEFPPKTTAYYNRKGDNGHEVWLFLVDGMGHEWPTAVTNAGIIANEVIWEFFSHYLSNTAIGDDKISVNRKKLVTVNTNPLNTYLVIQNKNSIVLDFTLTAMNGRLILSGTSKQNVIKIDIANYSRGLYLLHVEGRAFKRVFKFQNIRTVR